MIQTPTGAEQMQGLHDAVRSQNALELRLGD